MAVSVAGAAVAELGLGELVHGGGRAGEDGEVLGVHLVGDGGNTAAVDVELEVGLLVHVALGGAESSS